MNEREPIIVAGAGVAGLAAAWRLQGEADRPVLVLEKDYRVGGYCRTLEHRGFRFDLGGHRFYTKKAHVQRLVEEVVGEDLLVVDRLSRIFFNGRFVHYPLNPFDTLRALGLGGSVRAVLDYATMKLRTAFGRCGDEATFEQWALHRFGRYLYEVYFKVYSEKTWGIPCTELSADFAEQRIKKLSFREAVKDALLRKGDDESLVRRFYYPRYGFCQIPEGMAARIRPPSRVLTGREVVRVHHQDGRIIGVTVRTDGGDEEFLPCSELISSLPLDEIARALRPAAPPEVLDAARRLRFRSVVILFLELAVPQVSPDHWLYVPGEDIGFCRLHEPKNWSPAMAPPDKTGLVIEYFCQEGDERWSQPAEQMAREATADLARLGLVRPEWVCGFTTVKMRKAYPVYNLGYAENVETVKRYLRGFSNFYNVGRNATFRYTSSDHYIDMGLKAAENVLGHQHDLESVGTEGGYAEAWQEGEKWT